MHHNIIKLLNKNIILKSFKFLFISIISVTILIFSLFLVDAADFDTNYTNRSKIEFSYIHLNSRHSFKFAGFLKKNYFYFYELFFKESFEKRWSVESKNERLKLPETKLVKAKKNNFSKQLYNLEDYQNQLNWTRSHGNYFSTRFSNLKRINTNNIKELKLAWIYEPKPSSKSQKENQANIIYSNGKVFLPDVENNLVALNAKDGNIIWEFNVESGIAAKRGLILWKKNNDDESDSRIFFTNNRDHLFSINLNGEPNKDFGNNGKIKVGLTPLPPVIYKGELIVVTTDNIIKSYDIDTGKIKWKFKVNKTKNSLLYANFFKGSPWGGLSLDTKRGLLFFTTGNPSPWHTGIFRKGDNLYANSVVAFDLNQKDIKWYFQEVPHDVWNYDLAAPPILTMVKREGKYVDVVVSISKLGNVIILDRETGEPMFDIHYRLAPTSNIPGERTAPYQIEIKLPEKICRSEFKEKYLTNFDQEFKKRFINESKNYNFGYPSPPQLGKKTISIGSCVRWAGGSVDTKNNILYITSDNQADIITINKDEDSFNYYHEWDTFTDDNGLPGIKPPWGSITSLNLNTGKVLWTKPFGNLKELEKKNIYNTGSTNRAGLTATAGNIIFASGTEDNMFRVFDSNNGEELWSYQMDSAGSAPPTIFEFEKKQFILVPAYEKEGNKVYAFTLD